MPQGGSTAVVGELQRDPEVALAHQRDRLLQLVLVTAGDAHLIALDRRLHFQLGVLDLLHDRLRLLGFDPLHDLDVLPHRAARGLLDLAVVERLERDVALDELRLQDVLDAAQLSLVVGDEDDLVGGELDRALAALEVEALRELLLRLLHGVRDFLHVGLGDNVEGKFLRHYCCTTCTPAGTENLNKSGDVARLWKPPNENVVWLPSRSVYDTLRMKCVAASIDTTTLRIIAAALRGCSVAVTTFPFVVSRTTKARSRAAGSPMIRNGSSARRSASRSATVTCLSAGM